ncbi:hypothetical protein SAMN05444350_13822 [Bacteroides stercorirosoris]|uniref:Uncharacterized protein n=1 Tax=Bacteroides stercorirosoris TaxID=871324 RepID=A0A1M6KKJ0_9BACE|nr:hypothetical protein SAMN05444350_13822 [Bacteroides stercorirosoris]
MIMYHGGFLLLVLLVLEFIMVVSVKKLRKHYLIT